MAAQNEYQSHNGEIMKENTLEIIINKPVAEVFEFTTNPINTPSWIDCILQEKTNEWPPRIGTIYKNHGNSDDWSVYSVTKYEKYKEFELVKADSSTYHVNYSYIPISTNSTKLIYHEWVIHGKLESPFTHQTLNQLKKIMEKTDYSS